MIEKSLNCLEQTVSRNMDVSTLLVRAQREMKNMLLETGGKRMLAIQWQKVQVNFVLQLFKKLNL